MCRGIAGASGWRGAMIASNVSPLRARRATQWTISAGCPPGRRAGQALASPWRQTTSLARARSSAGAAGRRADGARRWEGVALAGAAHVRHVVQLHVDHGLEGAQQRREPLGRSFQRAQHLRQRLDGRDVVEGGLAPYPVAAGGGRREPELGQSGQHGVALEQLARLPPGSVHHHQRDRAGRARLRQIDRARAREQ